MNISVRLEGGLGDCLLGHRFSVAIKEQYPHSHITAYIDSEGKTFQKETIEILYPSFYKDIKIIPNKKYKEFWINSQFGTENQIGFIENVPDDIYKEMAAFDKFYDLHIDSLKWTKYDFDWLRYFKFFPKPELSKKQNNEDYAVLHLISASSEAHRMENWYIVSLIKALSKTIKCYIISTESTNHLYKELENENNIEIFNGSIRDVCEKISNSKIMLSTDSGFRYVAHAFNVPSLIFSQNSPQPFFAKPSHQIRWLMFPETCFPLHTDIDFITDLTRKILLEDKAYVLFPYINNFNLQMVKREYSVDLDKSILNEKL